MTIQWLEYWEWCQDSDFKIIPLLMSLTHFKTQGIMQFEIEVSEFPGTGAHTEFSRIRNHTWNSVLNDLELDFPFIGIPNRFPCPGTELETNIPSLKSVGLQQTWSFLDFQELEESDDKMTWRFGTPSRVTIYKNVQRILSSLAAFMTSRLLKADI